MREGRKRSVKEAVLRSRQSKPERLGKSRNNRRAGGAGPKSRGKNLSKSDRKRGACFEQSKSLERGKKQMVYPKMYSVCNSNGPGWAFPALRLKGETTCERLSQKAKATLNRERPSAIYVEETQWSKGKRRRNPFCNRKGGAEGCNPWSRSEGWMSERSLAACGSVKEGKASPIQPWLYQEKNRKKTKG